MKFWLMIFVLATTQLFADIRIENVKAEPISPWGKVNLQYDVMGASPTNADDYIVMVSAYNRITGVTTHAWSLTGETRFRMGTHKIVWDLLADGLDFSGQNLSFSVAYTTTPLYKIIDLSGGMSALSYPVTSVSTAPPNGWPDEYKTTKLVLQRVEAGTFMMGSPTNEIGRVSDDAQSGRYEKLHQVTLTKTFYMGVFEVTQRQWELVMGNRPSYFSLEACYQTRPVERVSFSASSIPLFVERLQAKTELSFSLPTEAQWEYACRAGTTTALNNGKNLTRVDSCEDLTEIGRCGYTWQYEKTCDTTEGTAKVGSYQPNAWDFYDMHGNVAELCLDYPKRNLGTAAVVDPICNDSTVYRVIRGGAYWNSSDKCRSAYRGEAHTTADLWSSTANYYGFRLCCLGRLDK